MFQDIAPYQYHCAYQPRAPKSEDYLMLFRKRTVLLKHTEAQPVLPKISDHLIASTDNCIYLFSIDETAFYLSLDTPEAPDGYTYETVPSTSKSVLQPYETFAVGTALHLSNWYQAHRFCGHCGKPMHHKADERAMVCDACHAMEFPKICPVIIVGVTHGDRLLTTHYADKNAYQKHTLIAGFVEIGETLEDAVRREVFEEVGLHVKNIRYYASQPWGFSESMIAGFFADLDGSEQVHLDHHEISKSAWYNRQDLPKEDTTFSITWDMIEAFRAGKEPKAN